MSYKTNTKGYVIRGGNYVPVLYGGPVPAGDDAVGCRLSLGLNCRMTGARFSMLRREIVTTRDGALALLVPAGSFTPDDAPVPLRSLTPARGLRHGRASCASGATVA